MTLLRDTAMTTDRHPILRTPPGFTLVEIMVTLGVLAIVAALASPAIMQMAPQMRLRTAGNELHADLQRAKSRAVKDNRNIGLSVTTAANCVVDANGIEDDPAHPRPDIFETDGNGGAYRIFVDDGAGNPLLARNNTWNAGEQILVDINDTLADGIDDLPANVAICTQTFATSSTGFTSTGLLQSAANGAITLEVWDTSETRYRYQVTLSPAGSVTIQKL